MTSDERAPVLQEKTVIGPYRIEVWVETGMGCSKVEVWKDNRLVRGPFRYTWVEDALSVASDMAALIRDRVGIVAP